MKTKEQLDKEFEQLYKNYQNNPTVACALAQARMNGIATGEAKIIENNLKRG